MFLNSQDLDFTVKLNFEYFIKNPLKVDMIDYAANMYQLYHRYHRKHGGKSAATVQFRMTVPGAGISC